MWIREKTTVLFKNAGFLCQSHSNVGAQPLFIIYVFIFKNFDQSCVFKENKQMTFICFCFVSISRYFAVLRRHNYVTPTSYLELIKTFKALLNRKRLQILTLKNRYLKGLEKLEFASSQVCAVEGEMQKFHFVTFYMQ